MGIIKHYKNRIDAEAACGAGHEIIVEGNAIRRYRIVTNEEAASIRDRERTYAVGRECAIPAPTGGFPGV